MTDEERTALFVTYYFFCSNLLFIETCNKRIRFLAKHEIESIDVAPVSWRKDQRSEERKES